MSEARSTPGPFEACKPGEYSDYKGNSIVIIGDDRRIAVVLGSDEESAANANLFAASPALLKALKDMLNGWRYIRQIYGDLEGVDWNQREASASAAIAKAGSRS